MIFFHFSRSILSKQYGLAILFLVTFLSWQDAALAQIKNSNIYPFPNQRPVATMNVPNSWNPNSHEDGVDGKSPDEQIFFDISITKISSIETEMKRIKDYIREAVGFLVLESSKQDSNAVVADVAVKRQTYALLPAGIAQSKIAQGVLIVDIGRLSDGRSLVIQRWRTKRVDANDFGPFEQVLMSLKIKK